VSHAQNTEDEEKQFTGTLIVKHKCFWMAVLRAIKQILTYNLVAFFTHIQNAQLIIYYTVACRSVAK
jgi:hypothetical protein